MSRCSLTISFFYFQLPFKISFVFCWVHLFSYYTDARSRSFSPYKAEAPTDAYGAALAPVFTSYSSPVSSDAPPDEYGAALAPVYTSYSPAPQVGGSSPSYNKPKTKTTSSYTSPSSSSHSKPAKAAPSYTQPTKSASLSSYKKSQEPRLSYGTSSGNLFLNKLISLQL